MKNDADYEIELKLAIAPGDVSALRQSALLREKCISGPARRKVFNIYFDTAEQALRQNGMALRLRRSGGQWSQTLKTAGVASGALSARGEWEEVLPGPQLDLSLLRETPLAKLAGRDRLHLTLMPVFTTVFNRTIWLIEFSPGQRVEIALDQGNVRCGEKSLAISEVEIELVEGSTVAVFDAAETLLEHTAFRPDNASKASRGYQLLNAPPLAPAYATPVKLKRKWRVDQAMQVIVSACLAHFAANVDGALTTDDPEYIHQMRVALRRLRSAIHLLRPADAGYIGGELRWLTNVLGQARDWDVLMANTLPLLIDGYADADAADAVMRSARESRDIARAAVRVALRSRRYARLHLALGRLASVPGTFTRLTSEVPTADDAQRDLGSKPPRDRRALCIAGFAAAEIRRRRHHLLRRAAAMTQLSPAELHRVRIDAKRLRYTIDHFASLFDDKRIKQHVKTLARLQDLLGTANDAVVASVLIKSIAPTERFMHFADGWLSAIRHIELAEIERHIRDLKGLKPLWAQSSKRWQKKTA
ncbi:MAG: CHAD domain-containing protein [Burkholderiales bacterium]